MKRAIYKKKRRHLSKGTLSEKRACKTGKVKETIIRDKKGALVKGKGEPVRFELGYY